MGYFSNCNFACICTVSWRLGDNFLVIKKELCDIVCPIRKNYCALYKRLLHIRLIGIACVIFMTTLPSNAQYQTLFGEDFESCAIGNLPICNWNVSGSGSRWTTTSGGCAISGLYSLAVGSDANFCEYNVDFGLTDRIAYIQFDATAWHDLTLSFDWKCIGEIGVDYGRVVWSPDGITWSNVTGAQYQNQITTTRDTLVLDPSLENDPSAFIGFRWFDDAANGVFPGFVIDNINIQAEPDTPDVPDPPTSAFPTACDSVIISWGGTPTSPNIIWYWQDSVCGNSTAFSDSSNYSVFATGTYYIAAFNILTGLWSTGCDSISVTVVSPSVANAGAGGASCDLSFAFSATPSIGIGTWSQFFGPGTSSFLNPNSPTDTVTVSTYGAYLFEWTEANGNCVTSDMITVEFFEQPVADANASSVNVYCALSGTIAANPSVGIGTWSQISGPSGGTSAFANANSAFTNVTVDSSGAYGYQWVEVNGACSDTDTVVISFFNPPLADAGPSANVLCDTSFTFAAVLGSGSGVWTQSNGPAPSTIINSTSPNASVNINTTGLYVFLWTTTDSLCTNSDTLVVIFEDPLIADFGTGNTECDLDFTFNATTTIGAGLWTQSSGPFGGISSFALATDPTTTVTVTQPGSYVYTWTETLGTCIDSGSVSVIFTAPVVANAGSDTSISLGNSIDLFGQGGTSYIWSPSLGLSDSLIYNPIASPIVTTTYGLLVIDNSGCFDTDSITITVDVDYNFVVSNIMTPNGDGYNDLWYIDNIEFYPECDVAIYNRYGNLIYSASPYNNEWDGTHSGNNLPDGAYYYVLKCPGTSNVFKGAITIFRRK
ncbi:MAG: hypothetical protein COB85_01395 [Bacteroidetes bacterium]|nr:MAG: hypothetical protein COB85_01395 [Bacteroidota bacterium]